MDGQSFGTAFGNGAPHLIPCRRFSSPNFFRTACSDMPSTTGTFTPVNAAWKALRHGERIWSVPHVFGVPWATCSSKLRAWFALRLTRYFICPGVARRVQKGVCGWQVGYHGICGRRCLRIALATCELPTSTFVQLAQVVVSHQIIWKCGKP